MSPERIVPYPGDSDAFYAERAHALQRARVAQGPRARRVLDVEDRRDSFIEKRLAPVHDGTGTFGRRSIHQSFHIEEEAVTPITDLDPDAKRRFSAPDAPPRALPGDRDGDAGGDDDDDSTDDRDSED